MVIFVKPNGASVVENTVLALGSNAGKIAIVSPTRPSAFVQLLITPPTGRYMEPMYAAPMLSTDIDELGVYLCSVAQGITNVAGRVRYQVSFEYEDGTKELTPEGTFIVAPGVITIPPDQPDTNMYEEIKSALISNMVNYAEVAEKLDKVWEAAKLVEDNLSEIRLSNAQAQEASRTASGFAQDARGHAESAAQSAAAAAESEKVASEAKTLLEKIPKLKFKTVDALPSADIDANTIYLRKGNEENGDRYSEHLFVPTVPSDDATRKYSESEGAWERIGSQQISLDGYATEQWVDGGFVSKEDLPVEIKTAVDTQLGGEFEIIDPIEHGLEGDKFGTPEMWKKNALCAFYAKPDDFVGVRFHELRVVTNGAGVVRFAVYNRVDTEDGASAVLTLDKILGEVQAGAGQTVTTLTIDGGYYTEVARPVVIISSTTENLGFTEVGSLLMKGILLVDGVDFGGMTEGESVTAPVGEMNPLVLAHYYLRCDYVKYRTVKDFAEKTDKRVTALESDTYTGIHVGPNAPTGDEKVWVDTNEEAEGGSTIPAYDLTAMGLSTVTVGGGFAALTTDTTQLRNDLASGSVKLAITMSFAGQTLPVSKICNALVLDEAGEMFVTFVDDVGGIEVHTSICILDGQIQAYSKTLESIVTPYIDAYMEDALGGDY